MKPECTLIGPGFFDSRYYQKFMNEAEGYVTPERNLDKYEIELYTESGGFVYIDSDRYEVKPGFILISKPGQKRNSKLHFSTYYMYLNIESPYLKEHLNGLPNFFNVSEINDYMKIISDISKHTGDKGNNASLYITSKIYEFCSMAYADICTDRTDDSDAKKLMFKAKDYIDTHYMHRISLKKISQKFNLNHIYFDRLFKSIIGIAPYSYLMKVRFDEAKRYLRFSNKTVDEIAELCGFSSASYFSAAFKNAFNISPTGFRGIQYNNYLADE